MTKQQTTDLQARYLQISGEDKPRNPRKKPVRSFAVYDELDSLNKLYWPCISERAAILRAGYFNAVAKMEKAKRHFVVVAADPVVGEIVLNHKEPGESLLNKGLFPWRNRI